MMNNGAQLSRSLLARGCYVYVLPCIFLLYLTVGCGAQSGSATYSNGKDGKITVGFNLPPEYNHLRDNGAAKRTAPSYVTGINVTISGADMSSQTLNVSLDSGEADFSVTPGTRQFNVEVQTNIGVTFTGSTTVELQAGSNDGITIDLVVNAPPTIDSITITPSSPKKAETVTFSITGSDADGDGLTYTGKLSGPSGISQSWSGASYSGAFTTAGSYSVSYMVEDGKGGLAQGGGSFTIPGSTPVVTGITASSNTPTIGETITLTCAATDEDINQLEYSWSDGLGWSATGKEATYTISSSGSITITCEVNNQDESKTIVKSSIILVVTAPSVETPSGVSAVADDQSVKISWTAVSGADSYNIYYSSTSGAGTTGTKITGATSPYTVTGLANETTYYFVVTAVSGDSESSPSSEVSATPNKSIEVPGAPTSVSATAGDGNASVSWSAPSSGGTPSTYNIYYSETSGAGTSGTKISGVSSPYTASGLTNGTTYYFVVTAVNDAGEGEASLEVSATPKKAVELPGAPTSVSATASDSSVSVSWSAPSSGGTPTSYNIYYSATSGAGTSGTKISSVSSPYTVGGLTNGTTYYFVVTAVNSAGESSASSQASAKPVSSGGGTTPTPTPTAPGAPTSVSATPGDSSVYLSWTAPTTGGTPTSYNIYYATTAGVGVSSSKIGGVTSTSHTVSGLTNGNTYYFVVTAANSGGESSISSEVSAKPASGSLTPPTTVSSASDGTGTGVWIYWSTVASATSYKVYYSLASGSGTGGDVGYTGSSTSANITGLTGGLSYYFVVTSLSGGNESIPSIEVVQVP